MVKGKHLGRKARADTKKALPATFEEVVPLVRWQDAQGWTRRCGYHLFNLITQMGRTGDSQKAFD